MLPPRDFKSLASAYSATPAKNLLTAILYRKFCVLSTDFKKSAINILCSKQKLAIGVLKLRQDNYIIIVKLLFMVQIGE